MPIGAAVVFSHIELPWASILGFVDVAVVMVASIVLAHRYERRMARSGGAGSAKDPAPASTAGALR